MTAKLTGTALRAGTPRAPFEPLDGFGGNRQAHPVAGPERSATRAARREVTAIPGETGFREAKLLAVLVLLAALLGLAPDSHPLAPSTL
jgi:hypothetical protein